MLAGSRSESNLSLVLVRPHFPSNLHDPKATPEKNEEAKKALAIKLLKIYYINAHCQREDNQSNGGLFSYIYSAAEATTSTVVGIGKQIANKAGYGEDSDTILSICDEIKTQIEHAKTYQQYVDLCNYLFTKAIEATEKSSSPRRVALFFAIMSLMQYTLKTTAEYSVLYAKKIEALRASFHGLNEEIKQLRMKGDNPNQKEEQLVKVIRELIILDDVTMYPDIFRLGNPYPTLFGSDSSDTVYKPFISQPFLSDKHRCDLYSILDNQLQKEQGGVIARDKMPLHTIINKNYPLCLQADITMFCLYNMANMSLGFATAEAMKDYDNEKDTDLRTLFTQNQANFIARNLPIETRKKNSSDKNQADNVSGDMKCLPGLGKEAKDAKGKEEMTPPVQQNSGAPQNVVPQQNAGEQQNNTDGASAKLLGDGIPELRDDHDGTTEDDTKSTKTLSTSLSGFFTQTGSEENQEGNNNNAEHTPNSSREIF